MTTKKTPLILGLGHKYRQGKDLAARTIIQERGGDLKIVTIAFADALRKEVSDRSEELISTGQARNHKDALRIQCDEWGVQYDPKALVDDVYPHGKQRALLQAIGQGRRDVNPHHWVNIWQSMVEASDADVILVPDMRYPNEAARIKLLGGVTIKFVRKGFVPDPDTASHISENALNDYVFDDQIVVNDGDLEMLHWKSLHVFDYILKTIELGI
jgi:hypothetical protein